MKLLLVSVLAVVLPALQGAHIPRDRRLKEPKTPGMLAMMDNLDDFVSSMTFKKEEGREGPCKSPQVFEGKFFSIIPKTKTKQVVRGFSFDGDGKRMRVLAITDTAGKSYWTNTVILDEKKMMYTLNMKTGQCSNLTYDKPWQPAGLPADANYYGTAHLAGADVANEGLLLDFYYGKMLGGEYFGGVTHNGCWGAFTLFNSTATGPTKTLYFDFTSGIKDPKVFDIPKQCLGKSG